MTASPATKAEVLAALRSSGDRFLSTLRTLPTEAFEQGRYEGGWNGRQILAHVAAIEWTYPRLLDLAARPRHSAPDAAEGGASAAPRRGMDGYNARQVELRAGRTVAELLDEFARNRAATIAAIEAADDAVFDIPITSAGGASGPLANVFLYVAIEHPLGHMNDIVGATSDEQ